MNRYYYTDGSALKNGTELSSGGYGVVEVDDKNQILWQYQDFKAPTTNNEMELMAILRALQHIKINNEDSFLRPTIYTDSQYAVNLINYWMYSWARNGWRRPNDEPVKNLNIIKEIYKIADSATVCKVKGHSGNVWNELADKLATGAIKLK